MISSFNRLYKRLGALVVCYFATGLAWGSVLFNDVATLPILLPIGVVIQTDSNGLWRITDEPTYSNYQQREPFYAYLDGGKTMFSLTTSGGGFHAEKMVPYSTEQIKPPLNIDPGVLLPASSGNIYKVLSGNFYLATSTLEDVYIYKYSGDLWASFKKTGIVVRIELLSGTPIPDPQPTPDCPSARFDAATNKVIVPCLEIQGDGSKLVFETEWNLTSGTDGVLTLKLQRAVPK